MPRLIAPTITLHAEWLEAHEEWGPGLHEDGFGLDPTDEVNSPEGFAKWVDRVNANSEHATCRWIMEGDRVQGAIASDTTTTTEPATSATASAPRPAAKASQPGP
ncbi:hypothetical protein [Kribbella sp. NPDC023855]|uniref:hypothetical protein n=1 Tax=Kribbella sp. NPDC023855 TaxID=3154698 RepID=UPI0033FD910F